MLALYGFITIIVFLVLIITRRLSVITAPMLVPVVIAFIAGFGYKEIGTMTLAGIKQVAPTGILLMFAVLFFSAMPADITQHQLFFAISSSLAEGILFGLVLMSNSLGCSSGLDVINSSTAASLVR